jgi:hypothetical protein
VETILLIRLAKDAAKISLTASKSRIAAMEILMMPKFFQVHFNSIQRII